MSLNQNQKNEASSAPESAQAMPAPAESSSEETILPMPGQPKPVWPKPTGPMPKGVDFPPEVPPYHRTPE